MISTPGRQLAVSLIDEARTTVVPELAEGWSGDTHNWGHIREVWLNPENDRALMTKVA